MATFFVDCDNKMAVRRDLGFLPARFGTHYEYLTCSIHKYIQEYNNLNPAAVKMDQIHDRVPSTNTEIVRHLELGSLEAQLLDKTEEVNSNC